MGFNWKPLGYPSLQSFINAMFRSEADHLDAFVRYVEANGLAGYLRKRQWAEFAKRYNGPAYKKNKYDLNLAAAYKKFAGNSKLTLRLGDKGDAVKEVQRKLGLTADGIFGSKTLSRIRSFQREKGLVVNGIWGPKCWEALAR
jgi:peptidoglycan hydrolase-like protein with peptidoglycan-binding domain